MSATLITRRRIRNVELYLGSPDDRSLYIVCPVAEIPAERLTSIGFSKDPEVGQTILPEMLGPIGRFNTNGSWIIHRDQPKEERYISTIQWEWTTWDGVHHSEFKDRFRECFPRERVPPPAVELKCLASSTGVSLGVGPIVNSIGAQEANKHIINLMLETCRTCYISDSADVLVTPTSQIRRLNWVMLPPGEYPWPKVLEMITERLKKRALNIRPVILDRQETIESYHPDEIVLGQAGFSDYIAYVFKKKNIVVLESIHYENALYILGADWETVSQMSKAEVLNNNLHIDRIIHNAGWKKRLHDALTKG